MNEANIDILMDKLREGLPPVFARESVDKLFGGLVRAKRLRTLDSQGQGPAKGRIKLNGQKVGYERDAFLEWLRPQLKSLDVEC